MMATTNFLKTYQLHHLHQHDNKQHQLPLPKRKFVTYAVYTLIAVALLYLFVDPAAPAASSTTTKPSSLAAWPPSIQQQDPPEQLPPLSTISPAPDQGPQGGDDDSIGTSSSPIITSNAPAPPRCDYADGEWVPDASPPLYNGSTCGAIKDDGRSCTLNGREDTDYVYWRWQPRGCDLLPFSASTFLRWLRNRHMAFVGDSLARNQAESLVCLLSSAYPPELVHRSDDGRFRRWVFRDHNATVSIFWSPFLVHGVEKSEHDGVRYNQLFLDKFDERWMSELAAIDALVMNAGQWFRIPSVYHEGGRVVGCHGCDAAEFNGTAVAEISFFSVFRDAVKRTLAEAARRQQQNSAAGKLVAMTTFSPSHFDGQWNEGAPCKKKADTQLGYTETEMRKIVVEEMEQASSSSSTLRFAAVDVTALANLRPDGHPGPYMRKNPFAAGNTTRVQHDCLHWCMPGPVDTFNQILLQTILR